MMKNDDKIFVVLGFIDIVVLGPVQEMLENLRTQIKKIK